MKRRGGVRVGRGRTNVGVLVRLAIYVMAAVVFFAVRSHLGTMPTTDRTAQSGAPDTTLVLAGADVAPLLVAAAAARYRLEYPFVHLTTQPGGSAQGLQDLVNGRAGASFLCGEPTPDEQAVFRGAIGDTALWYPVAVGAALVVTGSATTDTAITLERLRSIVEGTGGTGPRLFAPDPNSGLWGVVLRRLVIRESARGATFLADDDAVVAAVAAEPRALGLVSSLALRAGLTRRGVRTLPIVPTSDAPPVAADNVTLASASYPLWFHLVLAGRADGDLQGSLFITHLTSDRGQRQIEQTPYLPARKVGRGIVVTRGPQVP